MLLVALALFIAPRTASAHPESVSTLRLSLRPSEMHVTLILPVRDLSRWFPAGRYKNYTADVVRELAAVAGDLLVVAWDEDVVMPLRTNVHPGQVGFIIIEEDFAIPAGAGSLQMRSALLANLPNDHQQLTMVEDARRGAALERILAEETLTAQEDTLAVELPEVPAANVAPIASDNSSAPGAARAAAMPTRSSRQIAIFHPTITHIASVAVLLVALVCLAGGHFRRRGRVRVGSALADAFLGTVEVKPGSNMRAP
jgi:hypothetical protein